MDYSAYFVRALTSYMPSGATAYSPIWSVSPDVFRLRCGIRRSGRKVSSSGARTTISAWVSIPKSSAPWSRPRPGWAPADWITASSHGLVLEEDIAVDVLNSMYTLMAPLEMTPSMAP